MKTKIFSTLAVFLISARSQAQLDTRGVTLSDQQFSVDVLLNAETLKLSAADYSIPVVKVLIPALANITLLDHRNFGEGAPCLATFGTKIPQDVLRSQPGVEKIQVRVILKKNVSLSADRKTCFVSLHERVESQIRGFLFEHDRYLNVGPRHPEDCR